jgi:excisionase family DNA binding protein
MEAMLYTVKEVAGILHTNRNYVYQVIRNGSLPALKLGSLKVRKEALEQFLRDSEGKNVSDPDHFELLQ